MSDRVIQRIEYIPDEETELYFKAADVLMLPYTHIFQSGVLFLGYSFGLPVIVADVGSLKEEVIEGKTGFVTPAKDATALASVIEKFFSSELYERQETRRQEIRDYANDQYSWAKVGAITSQVYSKLLENRYWGRVGHDIEDAPHTADKVRSITSTKTTSMKPCDVAIIGAGPYGLSIAAHLRAANMDFRIFGSPMHTWSEQMPRGMRLKSEGFASSLYEPDSQFTLEAYCKKNGLPYADIGLPVPLETFTSYGLEFQRRFVPQLEEKSVVSLTWCKEGYQLGLNNGEVLTARRVVVAVGISHYAYVPPILSSLPETHLSHSSKHKTLDHFNGRDIIVIGAGASALDTAALLHQAGARVRVVARRPAIRFYDPPDPAPVSFLASLRNPISGIGRGWKLFLCANAPLVFRLMPEDFRLDIVRRYLGPGPGWFVTPDIVGKVPLCTGFSIKEARIQNGRVELEVTDTAGVAQTFEADHLIAGTGYRVDLRRLSFLDSNLLEQIRSVENTPILSSSFESSVRGLYFVGTSAANTFGPLLRFAVGAKFTARRLSRRLAKSVMRNGVEAGNGSGDRELMKGPYEYASNPANDRT